MERERYVVLEVGRSAIRLVVGEFGEICRLQTCLVTATPTNHYVSRPRPSLHDIASQEFCAKFQRESPRLSEKRSGDASGARKIVRMKTNDGKHP